LIPQHPAAGCFEPMDAAFCFAGGSGNEFNAGVLIFTIYFSQVGAPVVNTVLLSEVLPNSPAAQAGLAVGDVVLNANGEEISAIDQFRAIITANLDKPIQLVYERDGQQFTTAVTPSSKRNPDEGATGVILTNPIKKVTYLQSLPMGFSDHRRLYL